jgi:hypothetical protein
MCGIYKVTFLLWANTVWVGPREGRDSVFYSELKVWGGGGSGEGELYSDKRFAGSRVEDSDMYT